MAFPSLTNRPGFSWIWFLLLTGLSVLSWASTYTGIMELIAASSGDVGLSTHIAVAFAVCMLQLMTLYILDALFSEQLRWWLRPIYLAGYGVLFLISIGFAFGFYWKYLEAGSATASAAENSLLHVQQAMQTGTSRLEQLQATFATLETISAEKATQERTAGGTCGGGGSGDGPRRRLRDADAERFRFANAFIAGRANAVKADIASLGADIRTIAAKTSATVGADGSRAAFMADMNSKLSLTATRFNALRSDPQLAQLRDEFKTRGGQSQFPDGKGGTFSCPDQQLQTALNGVVRAIDELPKLALKPLKNYEGSEAVIEAFRRLTVSASGTLHMLVAELRNAITVMIGSHEAAHNPNDAVNASISTYPASPPKGLSERDTIPLAIAVFVDLCILLVSINRPFSRVFRTLSSMEAAQNSNLIAFLSPVYRVFSGSFDPRSPPLPGDIIAPLVDAVFDHGGKYYAAAPSNSRYVSSAFDLLQGQNFVKLLSNRKNLDDETIRQKLKERNSTLAKAHSFRVFEFAPDAWAEFLHAALGSAAAVEMRASKRRQDQQQTNQRLVEIPKVNPPARMPKEGWQRNNSPYSDELSQTLRGQADKTACETRLQPAVAPKTAAQLTLAPMPAATAKPVQRQAVTRHTSYRVLLPATQTSAPMPEPEPTSPCISATCLQTPTQPATHNALLALPSPHQTQTQTQPPQHDFAAIEDGIDPDPSDEICGDIQFPTKHKKTSEFNRN